MGANQISQLTLLPLDELLQIVRCSCFHYLHLIALPISTDFPRNTLEEKVVRIENVLIETLFKGYLAVRVSKALLCANETTGFNLILRTNIDMCSMEVLYIAFS